MSNQHCIACEQLDHWIEIDIRDENNHPFQGIKAFITDSGGNSQEVTLTGRPQLLNNLAPGIVTITLDTEPWLTESMARKPRLESEDNQVVSYSEQKNGFSDTPKNYLHLTSGDLVTEPPKTPLPERHQAGKGDSGSYELFTNKSYVLEVKAFNWLTVRMGLFFDGTGNNTDNALWGREQREQHVNKWMQKCGANSPEALQAMLDACEAPDKSVKVEGSATNGLTNIQKLKDLYVDDRSYPEDSLYQTSLYVHGIGTSLESPTVKGIDGDSTIGSGMGRGDTGVESRVEYGYKTIIAEFKEGHWPKISSNYDGIGKFEFDTFGFSRGAAAARHCVNQILLEEDNPVAKYIEETLSDIRLHPHFDWQDNQYCYINFVGIFDTVAAIITGFDGFDGAHDDDNGSVKLYLDPKRVGKVVHLTAHPQDEFRYNFSLNRLNNASSNPSSDFVEITLPGVHSDIGGGYPSRHFFSGKLQKYDPFFTDSKLVAIERSSYRSKWGTTTEEAMKKTKAYDRIQQEKQRLINNNWCQEQDLSIEHRIYRGQRGKEPSIVIKLTMSRIVEGDLSRLALRLMAGLAEFKGVKLDTKKESVWTDDNYVITDFNDNYQVLDQSFANISQQVLEQAKQGKVLPLLLDDKFHRALRPHFIHHSSGFETLGGLITPNVPNENFVRTSYSCKQGA